MRLRVVYKPLYNVLFIDKIKNDDKQLNRYQLYSILNAELSTTKSTKKIHLTIRLQTPNMWLH